MEKVIFCIVIGLLCLLIILILLSENLLPTTSYLPESLVKIIGEPSISYSKNDNYEYTIEIPAEIEYAGKWEIEGKAIDSVDVVSLTSFKGIDKKASVNGEDIFHLSKSNPVFEGTLSAVIENDAGPIKKIGDYYDEKMLAHESFLLTTEDDGNLLVNLGSIVGPPPYRALFVIECETDVRYIELWSWSFCEESSSWYPGEYEKCERYLEMCDGEVHIRLMSMPYKKIHGPYLTDEVIIEAKGGKPFEPGERVEVSFWRSSECVDNFNEFDELLSNCAMDFLGYSSLEGVIVV